MSTYHLLDLRGLVSKSLHSGNDPEGSRSPQRQKLNTPGHALDNFLRRYLMPIISSYRLNHVIAVQDSGAERRKALFPAYKQRRKEVEPEVKEVTDAAMDVATSLLKALGIPLVRSSGNEADDVLGHIAVSLAKTDKVIVHTIDQDMLQLADDNIMIMLDGKPATHMDLGDLQVPSNYVALCKSIVGDFSDGYPGVPGMGPKAFQKLVEAYGWEGLDELMDILDSGNMMELKHLAEEYNDPQLRALHDKWPAWELSWKLAQLHPEWIGRRFIREVRKPSGEIKSEIHYARLKWTKRLPNRDKLHDVLRFTQNYHWADSLEPFMPHQWLLDSSNVDPDEVATLAAAFRESDFVALDWETVAETADYEPFQKAANGREFVDVFSSSIVGAGFTFGKNLEHTFYSTYRHKDSNNLPLSFLKQVIDAIPADVPKVIHNTQFEDAVYKLEFGEHLTNTHDTKLMASHVDENTPNGLKDLSHDVLHYQQIHYRDVVPKGMTMADVTAQHVLKYGADDPWVTAHLYDLFRVIQKIEGTWDFCVRYEFAAVYPIVEAYLAGVSIDWDELAKQGEADQNEYDDSLARLRELLDGNQTPEMVDAGVAVMMGEWWPEKEAKLLAKGTSPEDMLAERNKFLQEVQGRVAYYPMSRHEVDVTFKWNKTWINRVLGAMGLPKMPKGDLSAIALEEHLLSIRHELPETAPEYWHSWLRTCAGYIEAKKSKAEGFAEAEKEFFDTGSRIVRESMSEEDLVVIEGTELNLDSPKQMQTLLYGMLLMPIRLRQFEQSKTRKDLGLEQTSATADDDAFATALAEDTKPGDWQREAIECWQRARKASTRLKMFYGAWPLWKHPKDGMLHPWINSIGTETRRPSGSSPNFLQVPKRGDGIKVRKTIKPNAKLGHDIVVSIDWQQQELRVAGAQSMDDALLDCYFGNNVEKAVSAAVRRAIGEERYQRYMATPTKDVHTQTGAGILGISYDVMETLLHDETHPKHKEAKGARTDAKPVNFGSTYNIGPPKLARQLMASIEAAKEFLNAKKKLYWQFEEWRGKVIDSARLNGKVTTPFGCHRHVYADIASDDSYIASSTERQVVNYLIQGTCADNLKKVLATLWREQVFERFGAVFMLPIYDELVFSCHHSVAVPLIQAVHRIMTKDIPGLPVPMLAEPSLGPNFGTQYEIGWEAKTEAILEAVNRVIEPLQEAA